MNARFFRQVQDAPWYNHFLNPVLAALEPLPAQATILDVGTGAGKLIELGQQQGSWDWVGADIDAAMLEEARQRPALKGAPLHQINRDGRLPFEDGTFDAVTYCSVLFLLPDPTSALREAWRVLKPNGRLVALTPSGEPSNGFNGGFDPRNWSFWIWRNATAGSGRAWGQANTLAAFAQQQGAAYQRDNVFHHMALIETVQHLRN